jgi:2,4-dichlorophenol 6-monooxygenase
VWVGKNGFKVSTKDLGGYGKFALLTGISGALWEKAASAVSKELGVDVSAYIIGPGHEYTDLYDDWARVREVNEDGCVLVRPDNYVGWRSMSIPSDPQKALLDVMKSILNRK